MAVAANIWAFPRTKAVVSSLLTDEDETLPKAQISMESPTEYLGISTA